jgi:DNA topoisomerase VI subunit B
LFVGHHTFGCTYAGGVSCPENFVLIGSYIGGTVLSGTKYGLKQTRGKFGLGAKMALIWSKMSTGLPIDIWSATKNQNFISFCRLDINIHK